MEIKSQFILEDNISKLKINQSGSHIVVKSSINRLVLVDIKSEKVTYFQEILSNNSPLNIYY